MSSQKGEKKKIEYAVIFFLAKEKVYDNYILNSIDNDS